MKSTSCFLIGIPKALMCLDLLKRFRFIENNFCIYILVVEVEEFCMTYKWIGSMFMHTVGPQIAWRFVP